jgi:nucleoside-diphosphate-sugar epimerase
MEDITYIGARKFINHNYNYKFVSSLDFLRSDTCYESKIIVFGVSQSLFEKRYNSTFLKTNINALVDKISNLSFEKLIFISSASVYGMKAHESGFLESDLLLGETVYAKEKISLESAFIDHSSRIGAEVVLLRAAGMFNLFTPHSDSKNLIDKLFFSLSYHEKLLLNIYHDGMQIRNFCEVSFFINVIHFMINQTSLNRVYNVANTSSFKLKSFLESILKAKENYIEISYVPDDKEQIHNYLDCSLLFDSFPSLKTYFLAESELINKIID